MILSILSIRVVYRNALLYYLLNAWLWFAGCTFLLWDRAGYMLFISVIKQAVIYGAHTDLRWDKNLYEIKWMSPIMWVSRKNNINTINSLDASWQTSK